MRFVVKLDTDKTAKLASNETYLNLLDISKKINKALISDAIYREPYKDKDEIRSRIEDKLALSYYNKCGYCERLCKADVEHYRPKKAVHKENKHKGYYWLCYEWSNLLPACVKCNRDGGKHSKFPILGKRVFNPSFLSDGNLNLIESRANEKPLIDEKPYLLHPEIDKPELFFKFILDPSGDGIRIDGIDKDGRGNMTIEICSLNRQELRLDRVQTVINPFKSSIESLFLMLNSGDIDNSSFVENVILQIKILRKHFLNEESNHTFLKKFIIMNEINFQNIMLPYINSKIRKIVFEAFKKS